MTFQQELTSWNPFSYGHPNVQEVPEVGGRLPPTPQISVPRADKKPVVLSFLRHCGCPFAEKAFRQLRDAAGKNANIHFVAISHSEKPATDKWLDAVGGPGKVEVLVDDKRDLFAAYGMGYSSFWAVLNPWSMSNVFKTGKQDGIWNKPTESGSRWQEAGLFSANSDATVVYAHKAETSDDLGDLPAAIEAVQKA